MKKRYQRGVRKIYDPIGLDRFRPNTTLTPGSECFVVASWGPFRGLETRDGTPAGSCGKGSLRRLGSVPSSETRVSLTAQWKPRCDS